MAKKMAPKYVESSRRDGDGRSSTQTYDYIHRLCTEEKHESEEVLMTGNNGMPKWVTSERSFWSAADSFEGKNRRSCEHLVIPLPLEMEKGKWEEAIKDFVESHLGNVPSSWAIHAGKGTNPHVHIIHSCRSREKTKDKNMVVWNSKGKSATKRFFQRNGANKDEELMKKSGWSRMHKAWVASANKFLDKSEHIDPQTKLEKLVENKLKEHQFQQEMNTYEKKNVIAKTFSKKPQKPELKKIEKDSYMPQWRMDRARKNGRKKGTSYEQELEREKKEFQIFTRAKKYGKRTKSKQRNEHERSDSGTTRRHGIRAGVSISDRSTSLERLHEFMEQQYESARGYQDDVRRDVDRSDQYTEIANRAIRARDEAIQGYGRTSQESFWVRERHERLNQAIRKLEKRLQYLNRNRASYTRSASERRREAMQIANQRNRLQAALNASVRRQPVLCSESGSLTTTSSFNQTRKSQNILTERRLKREYGWREESQERSQNNERGFSI